MAIKMGNDEFILHIRKNFPNCAISNDQLGKRIWQWLRENDPTAKIAVHDQPCHWGNSEEITSEITLPKTAAQFSFSAAILPLLYGYLAALATE
jgi:hypothetical protein